nr:uncharacterized mitochondrial protein AtMg00810-like [Tanacetum cinerariifolium]
MYGLHQAPRAWYGTLSKYLLKNGFQRGTIDQTLFIRRQKEDFILVQVYMDDIIFGSSNPQLCREVKSLMHEKFQMSDMGELNFFLSLQVLQKKDGIFLSQDKYIGDILKKFGFSDVRSSNTPMDKEIPWGKDGTRKDVELHLYKSMIGSLMYLTASRPDIILGLRYPKASPFDLVTYSDSDYGGASQDRKSTTGGSQFLGRRDCFEKKLISVDHIHTDENVADLLTKAFDARRFQYLVVSVGMTDPTEWKLYDLSGVHHVIAKDKEIFMLVEKDYPLRSGLALVMINYKLQIENYSQMAEDLIRKIYNIANTPRNLFPPLDNLELTIRRRSRVDHTLLNDFEMATNRNDDPPVLDLQIMKELCQPTLNGRGDDANKHLDKFLHVTQSIKVNGVTDDALRLYLFPHSLTHHATAWFDLLPRNSINTFEEMAKMFLEKYFPPSMVTKLRNEIVNFRQCPDESLFEAWECYKLSIDRCPNHNMLLITQIDTFYNELTLRYHDTINVAAGGTFLKRRPEECYDLIENMTAHHNDWDTSSQQSESSSSITSSSDPEIIALKAEMAKININLMKVLQINQEVKAVAHNCETCGGPHSYNDCPATIGQTQNVYVAGAYNQGGASHGQNPPLAYQEPAYQALSYQALVHQPLIPQPQVMTTTEFTNYMMENDAILKNMQTNMTSLTNSNLELKNMFGQFMKMNTASSSGSRTLPSNTITNPKEDLKGITTRSGTAYQGPTIPTTSSSLLKVVERETEVTKDMVPPTNNGSTKDVQPPVVQIETLIPNFEPVVAPVIEPVVSLVSAPKPNQKQSIPYPSRLHDQKLRDKTND